MNYDKLTLEEILRSLNKGGNSVRSGGYGYGGGYTPPAALSLPTVALLGPSTTQRNNAEASHIVYNMTSGPHMWAKTLDGRIQVINYYNASDPLGRNFVGNNYGLDSDPISNQITRIATIKAAKAGIIVWNSGRGAESDFVVGQSVNGYCDTVKSNLLELKTTGKQIIWENLWPRHTSVGGGWASGGPLRSLLLGVNTEMASFCNKQGITVADIWSVMVDQTDADLNPKANYYSTDGIHYAAGGAYRVGAYYASLYAQLCASGTLYDASDVANRSPNPTLTGTGGTATGNGATGVCPDSWTLSRSGAGNARSLTGSIEVINGKNYMVMTVGSSGTVGATGEGFTFRPTTTPTTSLLESAKWYKARCRVIIDNWTGWTGIKLLAQDAAGTPNGSADGTPGTGAGGNSPLTGFSGSGQYQIFQDAGSWVLETQPFLSGSTDGTLRLNFTYLNATGSGVIKVSEIDLRETVNPATLI